MDLFYCVLHISSSFFMINTCIVNLIWRVYMNATHQISARMRFGLFVCDYLIRILKYERCRSSNQSEELHAHLLIWRLFTLDRFLSVTVSFFLSFFWSVSLPLPLTFSLYSTSGSSHLREKNDRFTSLKVPVMPVVGSLLLGLVHDLIQMQIDMKSLKGYSAHL